MAPRIFLALFLVFPFISDLSAEGSPEQKYLETVDVTLPRQGKLVQLTVMLNWKAHCDGVHRDFIRKDLQASRNKNFVVSLERIGENNTRETIAARTIPHSRLSGTSTVVMQFPPISESTVAGLFICSNSTNSESCSHAAIVDISSEKKQREMEKKPEEMVGDKLFYYAPLFLFGNELSSLKNRLKDKDLIPFTKLLEARFGFNFMNESRAKSILSDALLLKSNPLIAQGASLKVEIANKPRKKC